MRDNKLAWKNRKPFKIVCQCGCNSESLTKRRGVRFIKGHYRRLQVGIKNPSWKGGVTKDRGYIKVYSPNHPHNDKGYVKRSRLNMEKKLGRFLESWEIVHHINGIKDDDRIENLFLTTFAKHNFIHKGLDPKKWSREYNFCQKCGRNDIPYRAKGMCDNCYGYQWRHQKTF